MIQYLIVCRSLTCAQRAARILERAGISVQLFRSPRVLSEEGCSYSIKLSERYLSDALVRLKRSGLSPVRIYVMSDDGNYREVQQ